MNLFFQKKGLSFILLLLLLLAIPITIPLTKKVQTFFSRAFWQPANIVVDTKNTVQPLNRSWTALAQGGEENGNMLLPVINEIKELNPSYIRIDHIFDMYDVVSGGKGSPLVFDFTRLDSYIEDIIKTGAIPLISLSYMPPSVAVDGQITGPPQNWADWEQMVQKTIEHYSGINNKNILDVYYEVWNEPDLFGDWKIGKDPNYLELYRYAASGAAKAQNTNQYFFGGPGTTGFYPNWINALLKSGYRTDFISWHRYSENPSDFETDINALKEILLSDTKYLILKRLITEWGPNSENSSVNDSQFAAAHLVATTSKIYKWVDFAFIFEIKDGPDPNGQQYWGRWGILTHEKNGVVKKPRYQALSLLNKLKGQDLPIIGEGTFVTGIAAKENNIIRLILSNFDQEEKHTEAFPVTFNNLDLANYTLTQTKLNGEKISTKETAENGTINKFINLGVNEVVLLELTP